MDKTGNYQPKDDADGNVGIAEIPAINDTRSDATIDKSASASEAKDPTSGIDTSSRRRRERPSASRSASSAPAKKLDLSKEGQKSIATQLVGLHKILGLVTGNPTLCEITDDQAQALTQAVMQVMDQYKLKPNPKVVAWANLAGIATAVYAPKIAILYMQHKASKRGPGGNTPPPAPTPERPASPLRDASKMVFN